jgi:hypothetical protein
MAKRELALNWIFTGLHAAFAVGGCVELVDLSPDSCQLMVF